MNKSFNLIILLLTCKICIAQNLVPNGSFEQYYVCPDNQNQIDTALFWMNPSFNPYGTPDYFNECSSSNFASLPYNVGGFQYARSGTACAGAFIWKQINVREYIEVSLIAPLVADTCYYFEMYINLSNTSRYTTDDIQAYFSDTAISGINNYYPLPFTPQILNPTGNIFDTLNWTLVSGTYTAMGGESYLIIGNFMHDSLSNGVLINPTAAFGWAYCFIDDVSLVQIPPCITGWNEFDENSFINLYPNPVINELNVKTTSIGLSEIILYDVSSRKLLQQSFVNSTSINTEQLAKGIYVYEVRYGSSLCKKGKLVKY
ncbi:MAG: T9SS type A sorting domain-containing protein [Bacteroidetes bacterium]|nr:T9SS type A sorting domain-containing protein [Bacteroidota bacterium]